MTKILAVILALTLSGCSTVTAWVPSFWDDNQAAYITSVRLDIERLDCGLAQAPQVDLIWWDLRRFELYSQSKGSLQRDVLRVIEPLQATVKEWRNRGEGSRMYCELKRDVLKQQGDRAARVILGRW